MDERPQAQRYPLSWPLGWKRTAPGARQRARFSRDDRRTGTTGSTYTVTRQLTVADGLDRLMLDTGRLGASGLVVSTNIQVKRDGLPYSGQRDPDDPGAAIYFTLNGKPRCLACDRWNRVADNLAAIAGHISAIRAVDRYGVGTMEQAFAGYAALPPSSEEWWLVLGVKQSAGRDDVEAAFRALAKKHHPDIGGSVEQMAKLNRARQAAQQSFSQ